MKTKAPPCPQLSWEMCKHSFTCTVSPPPTLIRHENGTFELKRRFKPEKLIWKCRLCPRFSVDCRKRSCYDNHVILLSEFCSHKSKMNADYCVFKFLWYVFRVKTAFSSFRSGALRRGPTAGINKWSICSHKLDTEKRVEKTTRSRVFLTNFEVSEIWFKAVSSVWYSFYMEIKANFKAENEIVKSKCVMAMSVFVWLNLMLLNED